MSQSISIVVEEMDIPENMSVLHHHILEDGTRTTIPVRLKMKEEFVHKVNKQKKIFSAKCVDCGETITIHFFIERDLPAHYEQKGFSNGSD